MKYTIYTDGACSGNPGPGGWGVVILDENKNQYNISGKAKDTTNNRMELTAPIMALKKIKTKSDVTIFTDSVYVKNGITEWIKKWEKNGWKNANKKPIKNKDLWIILNDLCKKKSIIWKWIRGHSNNKYNDLADELATKAIDN
jgi:ribonuclease HI